jgi:hypothetical protein
MLLSVCKHPASNACFRRSCFRQSLRVVSGTGGVPNPQGAKGGQVSLVSCVRPAFELPAAFKPAGGAKRVAMAAARATAPVTATNPENSLLAMEYSVIDGRAAGIRIGREVSRRCHACRRQFGENLLF